MPHLQVFLVVAILGCFGVVDAKLSNHGKSNVQRQRVVQSFNVHRNASSKSTPLQVGNGNFAFGADITGLQTFAPFSTMSTWAWHNFSLPDQQTASNFTGMDWFTHGKLMNYNIPNPAEPQISDWLIQNPHRLNMVQFGLDFGNVNVSESDLEEKTQELDLWSGSISSSFVYNGTAVHVQTYAHPELPMVAFNITSELFKNSKMGFFMDFPYPDKNKFDAPYVGVLNNVQNHTVSAYFDPYYATVQHTIDNHTSSSYFLNLQWNNAGRFSGPLPGTNRYVLHVGNWTEILFVAAFSPAGDLVPTSYGDVTEEASDWWSNFWTSSAFIDLTAATDSPEAKELQRRTILSQYILAVNSASDNMPQESGLVNNGWYGKFHLEMAFWHLVPFARWRNFDLLSRSLPGMYTRFLSSSYQRAKNQGYKGARWGKMSDPTGRSAPGEINALLIWQQPHPIYFAELYYRAFPNSSTLEAWDEIVTASADFMASYAFRNKSTGVFDLGPPMYTVAEKGNPNATINPAFELAYWRFGLDTAIRWKQRQNAAVPCGWTMVRDLLAPLPIDNGTFVDYEGVPGMWVNEDTISDHPSLSGVFGWLPPPASGPQLNMTVVKNTADKIRDVWKLDQSFGWDFPMLAMNYLRLGDVDQAISYLMHADFAFDDAGYAIGGNRVTTPYLPGNGGFLIAMAMLAGGWDGSPGPHFPPAWKAAVEGFVPGI